jgi:alpha-beta hydrolase superfamily lysophospholipase
MSVHRTYRHLAERLAANGFPALRFDYDGTGDSAGTTEDPKRMRAWVGSIDLAIAEARALSGAERVALFGVRFGATLAALAAIEHGDIEALISWAPVISGRVHVREIRGFRLLKDSKAPEKRSDGSEQVGGYLFSAETLNDMATIDLLAPSKRVAKRVLVLPRNERSKEEARLVDRLAAGGSEVLFEPRAGYAKMMRDDPYESVVPFDVLDTIVEWLARSCPPEARPPRSEKTRTDVMLVATPYSSTPLKETAVRFGNNRRLFGILAEPQAMVPHERPVLCFLNVGANHHVGPHRMNVDLARELAARGYRTFRFDAAGLGESAAEAGARENRIYTKDSIADVKHAMALLGEMRGADRFVVIGLCSGAYLAYHAAIADERIVGQVLLSPFAFEWKEGDPVVPTTRQHFRSQRYYLRALLDWRVWRRAVRGELEIPAIARGLSESLKTKAATVMPAVTAFLSARRRPQNEVEKAFRAVSDRGVQSLMVLSFEDSGVDMVARYLGTDARKMRGRKNFSFIVVDGADHTFMTLASQSKLRDILNTYVSTLFA